MIPFLFQILLPIVAPPSSSSTVTTPTLVLSEITGRESTGNGNGTPSVNGGIQFGTSPWTVHYYFAGPYLTGALGGANNCLVLARTASSALTFGAWSDDKSDTFTKIDSFNDTSNGAVGAGVQGDAYITQATTGAESFSFTVTGTVADGSQGGTGISVHAQEFADCTGLNAHNAGSGQSLSVTSTGGGKTFLWAFGVDVGGVNQNLTSITAGSGFALLAANRWAGELTEWNSTQLSSGSHTCAYTTSGSDTFDTICAALNVGTGGNGPSAASSPMGFYIHHISSEWEDVTVHTMQFPSDGSAVVGTMAGSTFSAVSDSGGAGSWVVGSIGTGSGKQGYCGNPGDVASHIVYNLGVTTSSTLTISPTYSACAQNQGEGLNFIQLFDLVGTVSLDTSHVTNGNQSTAGNLTGDSITPAGANELIFNVTPWANSSATGVTTSGAVFSISWDTWDSNFGSCSGPSHLQDDDGRALLVSTGASSVSFTYSNTGGTTCFPSSGSVAEGSADAWSSISMAFK